MLCRAKASSVSQVALDVTTDSVLFFPTGGVSFCSGVDRARGSFGEPKVTPPFLVYTLSDVTSFVALFFTQVLTILSLAEATTFPWFQQGHDAAHTGSTGGPSPSVNQTF